MKAVSHHAKRMLPNLIPRMKKQTVATPSTNQRMICPKTLGNFGVETLHCDVNSSRVTRQDARAFLRPAPPPRRSFSRKVQEHLPTDVCGILQSCEFIIHGARFSEEKHTGRWRTGNWPERLRCTKSGDIVIMLLTLDRTCPTLAHWVTPKQVHTWFQTSFIPTSQCCTISMMCKRAVGLPAHLGRQL